MDAPENLVLSSGVSICKYSSNSLKMLKMFIKVYVSAEWSNSLRTYSYSVKKQKTGQNIWGTSVQALNVDSLVSERIERKEINPTFLWAFYHGGSFPNCTKGVSLKQ